MTIKDNRYVSRQLDQQCKEEKMQYRKVLQYKALLQRKRNLPVGFLKTSSFTTKFDLNAFLSKCYKMMINLQVCKLFAIF